MAHLLIEQGGDGAASRVDLGHDVFTIGRGSSNDLHFRNPWLSRLHAKIIPREGIHYLVDAGSRNGTYLNGQVLRGEHILVDGDVIALGDILLRFADAQKSVLSTLRLADSTKPLPANSTVLINSQDLVFDRYSEPPGPLPDSVDTGVPAAGTSLLPALTRAAAVLIHHHPLADLLDIVLDLSLETVAAERGVLLLNSAAGELQVEAVRGYGGHDVSLSRTLIREVLDNRQAVLTVDAQSDDRFEQADSIMLQGIRSILCVPLWNNHEVIGLLYLDQRLHGDAFCEDDLRVTGLIANLAAVKIENVRLLEEQLEKKRMEEQLALGSKIQRGLLPGEDPDVPGYDICGENRSCYEIGGDYFDFIRKRDGKLAVVVADISGKGVGAALLMVLLQASLRTLIHIAAEPGVLADQLNRVMVENSPDNKFATLFYAELDPESHTLEYVNCGHNPALLLSADGVEELEPTGPIVGLFDDAEFECRRVALAEGGVLLLYTDGISEVENRDGDEFGTVHLSEILRQSPDMPGRQLIHLVRARVEAFGEVERNLSDDSTLVVVRRVAPGTRLPPSIPPGGRRPKRGTAELPSELDFIRKRT